MDTNNEHGRPTRRSQTYRNASDSTGNARRKARRPLTQEEKVRLANRKKIDAERQRRADYAKAQNEANEAAERRRERQRLAAQRRKRQIMIRIALLAAAVFLVVFGIIAFKNLQQKKALEPEGGAGTNILAAAEAANQSDSPSPSASDADAPEGLPIKDKQEETKEDTQPRTQESETLSICMVGDVILHQSILDSCSTDNGYDFSGLFANIAPEIQKYDIRIVNQETILGGPELEYSGYPTFNSPYEEADALANAGFNVILQATNHTLDMGPDAVTNNMAYWRNARPEIAVLGIHDPAQPSDDVYVYEKNGFRVAILNYTYGTNKYQDELFNGEYQDRVNLLSGEKVYADVQRAKELADYVILCPHWGNENELSPNDEQNNWAQNFLQWGVDLVLGTHPHVIQPVQVFTREDGHRMLVYYSVGNFISNQSEAIGNVGAMAQIILRKNPDGTVSLDNYGVETLVTHENPNQTGYTTYILDEYPDELAVNNGVILTDSSFSKAWSYQLRDSIFGELGPVAMQ